MDPKSLRQCAVLLMWSSLSVYPSEQYKNSLKGCIYSKASVLSLFSHPATTNAPSEHPEWIHKVLFFFHWGIQDAFSWRRLMSKWTLLLSVAFKSIPPATCTDVSAEDIFPQRVDKITQSCVLSACLPPSLWSILAAPQIAVLILPCCFPVYSWEWWV